jgi:AcrR family transcriptional regulator
MPPAPRTSSDAETAAAIVRLRSVSRPGRPRVAIAVAPAAIASAAATVAHAAGPGIGRRPTTRSASSFELDVGQVDPVAQRPWSAEAPASATTAVDPAPDRMISVLERMDMIRTLPYGVVDASATRHANTKVGKEEWTTAALEVIAVEGVDGLKVESLANRLGITKGSFYWHFVDRRDLIEGALEMWYRLATVEVIERLDRIDDPEQRLRALFAESFGDIVNGPIDALLVGQVDDPVVGPMVVRVTAERLEFLNRAYRDLGLSRERAAVRARLAYAAYLGISHLRRIAGGAPSTAREESALDRELDILLTR